MASILKEILLASPPEAVWGVVRDIGAVHTRFAPGFVVDTQMDGADRIVTFANGFVAREVIVDLDEAGRRLAYSARSERLAHHNASFTVIPDGAGTRLVWRADVLPAEAAVAVAAMMSEGADAARRGIDGVPA
ncbi:MAG TPA: SRPBCC family protein [Caulobacteraceae bacterium]|nr:SRPBCC family protein [Caulobacteraceae bacterium]